MAQVTDCTRYDCRLAGKRRRYDEIIREWQCDECGGRPVKKFDATDEWVECGRCGSTSFVHDNQAKRDRYEVYEVLDGLPQELVEQLK